jgi:hypothetical protein
MENEIKIKKSCLFEILSSFYGEQMVYATLRGAKRPSYATMYKMWKEKGIPFEIWMDIKKHLIEEEEREEEKAS